MSIVVVRWLRGAHVLSIKHSISLSRPHDTMTKRKTKHKKHAPTHGDARAPSIEESTEVVATTSSEVDRRALYPLHRCVWLDDLDALRREIAQLPPMIATDSLTRSTDATASMTAMTTATASTTSDQSAPESTSTTTAAESSSLSTNPATIKAKIKRQKRKQKKREQQQQQHQQIDHEGHEDVEAHAPSADGTAASALRSSSSTTTTTATPIHPINQRDHRGNTALHLAIHLRRHEMVQLLLDSSMCWCSWWYLLSITRSLDNPTFTRSAQRPISSTEVAPDGTIKPRPPSIRH